MRPARPAEDEPNPSLTGNRDREPGRKTPPANRTLDRAAAIRRIAGWSMLAVPTVALVLFLIRYGTPLWHLFRNPEQMQAAVTRWGAWAPIGLILLQLVQILLAPLPGNIVAVIAGYVFGLGKGLLLCMVGVVLGASLAFGLSKLVGRRALSFVIRPELMARFDAFATHRGPFYIFLLLLVPNPIGDWIYYLAGFTVLPLPVFLLLVLVGRIPTNLVEVFVGAQVYRLGSAGYHLAWWQWTLFAVVIIVLASLYYLNRKRLEAFFMRFIHFPGDST